MSMTRPFSSRRATQRAMLLGCTCLFGLARVASASPGCMQLDHAQIMLRPWAYTGSTDQSFNPGDEISLSGTLMSGSYGYARTAMKRSDNVQVLTIAVYTSSPSQSGSYVVPAGRADDGYNLEYNGGNGDPIQLLWNCTAITAVLSAVVPASGAQGSRVTLLGTGFQGTSAVEFGGAPATGFTVLDDTRIVAVAPAGSGSVEVSVTTDASTVPSALPAAFQYIADLVFQDGFE